MSCLNFVDEPTVLHPDVFWAFCFLKLGMGYFSDTQKAPTVVAECPKILDV